MNDQADRLMCMFSIVIPVYNAEKYLNECVMSIINQKEKNYEIILVDDGSSDSSGTICDHFKDRYPDYIVTIHQKNAGQISARMTGVNASHGEYICFVDSDDTVEIDWLYQISNIINETQSDVVIYDCNHIDENGKRINVADSNSRLEGKYDKKSIFKMIISSSALNSVCLKVCKKSLFGVEDAMRQFYQVRVGEDLLQTLPLLYGADSFYITDKRLYNYRVNTSSVTHRLVKRHYEYLTVVKPVVLDYMKKLELDTETNVSLFYTCFLNDLWRSLYSYFVLGKGGIDRNELNSIVNNEYVHKSQEYLKNNHNISRRRKIGLLYFFKRKWLFLKMYFCLGECINRKRKTLTK